MTPDKITRQNRVREALGRIYHQHPPHFREYLQRFQEDPTSRVFAPLAEAYRKMGQVEEAIAICREGLEHHPDFHGGRVALAKCYIDKKKFAEARAELERVIQCLPENLLAQRLLGDTFIALHDPVSALHCYKMAVILSPQDVTLSEKVRELEKKCSEKPDSVSFTEPEPEPPPAQSSPPLEAPANEPQGIEAILGASGIEDDPFKVEHVSTVFADESGPNRREITTETLGDLYLSQGQFDRSLRIFEKLESHYPSPDLSRKISVCRAKLGVERESIVRQQQIELLRSLLKKVREERR